jgi:hypothetical protein
MPLVAPIIRAVLGAAATAVCLSGALAVDDILFERDTPYVPTPQDVVERMLDMAAVRPGEILVDLGSGDGRIAITAAQRGARAFGVDLNPVRVKESIANAAKAGVAARATFEVKDLFDTDLRQADVVTTYLLPLVNLDLRPRILEQMKPGARLVTHAFDMGDWWPDTTDNIRDRVLFTWIIPAKVGGRWQVTSADGNFVLDVEQAYQFLTAKADVERRLLPEAVEAHTTQTRDGRINGTEISFAIDLGAGPRVFRGHVENDTILGIAPRGWTAVRTSQR